LRRQIQGEQARKELLGYPRQSFESLFVRLRDLIERDRGRVLIDRPAARLGTDGGSFVVTAGASNSFRAGHDPRGFEALPDPERYDAVVATVPSDVFCQLLDPDLEAMIDPAYLARVRSSEYNTALCVLLEVDRRVTSSYWTNICDPEIPFIGLIEQTNFVEPERYGGRRFVYIANYVPPDDPLLALTPDDLLAAYEPGIRKVNPEFSSTWIKQMWRFVEPAAQPIPTVGYPRRMPPLQTGAPGLVLANTTQIYPEDRGTNYSVRLGDQAAQALLAQRLVPAAPAGGPRRAASR
jgi:protoporphyrinogen oxidase